MKQTKNHSRWKMLPLRYKLSLYFIAFSVLMLGFLWIFQIAFLETSYTVIKQKQITNCANEITEKLINKQGTIEAIDNISKNNEMSVYIYDSGSPILMQRYSSEYNNPVSGFNIEMSKVYSYYRLATENNGVYIKAEPLNTFSENRFSPFSDNPMANGIERYNNGRNLIYAEIINIDDTTECFVIVSAMITPVSSVVETLRSQLIIVSVVFIVIAIILAIIVAKHISNPLVTLNTSVKELAMQNYNVEFNGSGYLEVKELSDTLNLTRDELVKVEKLRQELIANISHDLRTPLTMITGYAEVMRDLPGENTPENVQVIIDEANRLTTLVNDMLDLSKLQAGAMTLQRENYSLTQSIEEIFGRYTKLRQQEGYDIKFVADKDVIINADKVKMGQVIYNFINNAINHCGEDKAVIVTQKVILGKVRIEVTDHGEGIEQEKLQYIWDRYYKVDKEHRRGVIGTGLGLSIVKRILDMHSARYGVKSKLNYGSTFWFELDAKSVNARAT